MLTADCISLFSRYFPFWEKLTEQDKDELCRSTALTTYRKGANIHGGSGECTGAILVKSGSLRAYLLSEEGREITLYRLFAGDICMLSASCVLQAITFDVFVDAEEDSELYIVNGKALARITSRNIYAENFALNVAVSRFSDVMWILQQILFMSLDKRLAIFLNDEIAKNGGNVVHLTHDQVARYMGSAREVVSRMLKYFASEGIVALSRGDITILDKTKLRALCA